MDVFLKAAAIGVIAVILILLLKSHSRESAFMLSICACTVIGLLLLRLIDPILSFFETLRRLTGLDEALLTPVCKSVGIGLLTQICSNLCADGGESAIGKLIDLCGSILAIYVSIPLLEAVIQMIETLGGG